ncbi:unnamed protein product [Trichogramma brassicae]|uniref:Uncharacterized protein n=1 Tax=Trichogramma brassicae TaxID=86971 RepID=A0A6H5HZC4_9HYME|nr:unnamed protein product [Trichogramma brassicae]
MHLIAHPPLRCACCITDRHQEHQQQQLEYNGRIQQQQQQHRHRQQLQLQRPQEQVYYPHTRTTTTLHKSKAYSNASQRQRGMMLHQQQQQQHHQARRQQHHQLTKEVSYVLAYYRDEGLITVLPWKIPPKYKFERDLSAAMIIAAPSLHRFSSQQQRHRLIKIYISSWLQRRRNWLQRLNFLPR